MSPLLGPHLLVQKIFDMLYEINSLTKNMDGNLTSTFLTVIWHSLIMTIVLDYFFMQKVRIFYCAHQVIYIFIMGFAEPYLT
jgi:hypothetical protein